MINKTISCDNENLLVFMLDLDFIIIKAFLNNFERSQKQNFEFLTLMGTL